MTKAKDPHARPNNGRPVGSSNKRTAETYDKAKKTGELPVDFLLKQMRNDQLDLSIRMSAATSVAPYIHARLNATTVKADLTITHEQALKDLE